MKPVVASGVASRAPSRVLIALALIFSSLGVLAQPASPPPPANFFTDTASVVPADVAARIEQRLREFERASSNQVLVVVADRVPEGYASLEEYTNRTAEAWRVGDKSRDNGAVLFVFVRDRQVRIEVGYGLEGALPDALASRIINDEITPRFRAGKYGEGLLAGVDAITQATRGEYQPAPSRESAPLRPAASSPDPTALNLIRLLVVLGFLFFFLVIAVVIQLILRAPSARGSRTYSGRGSSGRETSRSWGSSTGGGSGGGSSRGGGGGFSGGGGSFGGGGASGSW